jgi:hypothetical protein
MKEKIAISLEAATLAKVRAQVRSKRASSVSAYISSAVAAQLESDAIARLVEDFRLEKGPPSAEAKKWARAVLGR